MTRHEAILAALEAALLRVLAPLGVVPEQLDELPDFVPAAGLVSWAAGDPEELGRSLGVGLCRELRQPVVVTLVVQTLARGSATERLQLLLEAIGTLHGAPDASLDPGLALVDWIEIDGPLAAQVLPVEGAGLMRAVEVQLQLHYLGEGNALAAMAAPGVSVPGIPAASVLAGVTGSGLTATWAPPASDGGSAVTGYDLRWSVAGGSWTTLSDQMSPVVLVGLAPGTAYEVQVRARNAAGAGGWSTSAAATTAIVLPGAPPAPSVSADGATGVSVAWVAPGDTGGGSITGYDLRHATGGGGWTVLSGQVSPAAIGGLAPLTSYDVQVRAVTGAGAGPWSASGTAATAAAATAPAAPAAPSLTATSASITASFADPATGGSPITSRDLRWSADGGTSWTTVAGVASPHTITGLAAATAHLVQVRAVNAIGVGPWSGSAPITTATAASVPGAPAAPVLDQATPATLRASWSAPVSDGGSAITGQDLRWSADGGGSWTVAAGVTSPRTIAGLAASTLHLVQVRAVNAIGAGAWSASASLATTAAATVPAQPAAPVVTGASSAAVSITWAAPADGGSAITRQDLDWSLDGGATWTTIAGAASPQSISGLTPAATVTARVRAVNAVGPGSWSPPGAGASLAAVPAAPAAATISGITHDSLVASWSAPAANGSAITGYDYRLSANGGASWSAAQAAVSPQTIGGLTAASPYQVQVRAANGVGAGPWSASASATTAGAPTAPGAPAAPSLAVAGTSITVTFVDPSAGSSPITRRDVRISANGGTSWTVTTGVSSPHGLTGLAATTSHLVQVRAVNAVGDGPWSASASATTGSGATVPGTPATPTVFALSHEAVSARFEDPAPGGSAITRRDLRVSSTGGTSWTVVSDVTLPRILGDLPAETAILVQARAVNAVGAGGWSASGSATTWEAPAGAAAPRALDTRTVYSGHSLTDPVVFKQAGLAMVTPGGPSTNLNSNSTIPGSSMAWRWENSSNDAGDARYGIANFDILVLTQNAPMLMPSALAGTTPPQWELDYYAEQFAAMDNFIANAWTNGAGGAGATTILYASWTQRDVPDEAGFRSRLLTQWDIWRWLLARANSGRPSGCPEVAIIPGPLLFLRVFDDMGLGLVPGFSTLGDFYTDDIHPTETMAYAMACLAYAVVYRRDPRGLSNVIASDPWGGVYTCPPAFAAYAQAIAWEIANAEALTLLNAGTPAAVGSGRIAYNLNELSDWTTAQPFLNVMKTARTWTNGPTLNAQGYPVALPGGPALAYVLTNLPAGFAEMSGRFRLSWQGTGTVEVGGTAGAAENQTSGTRWIEFDHVPAGSTIAWVQISATSAGDPVRDMVLARTADLAAIAAGAIFRPAWLEHVRGAAALRFMDWMHTNNATMVSSAQLAPVDYYSYGTARAVPVEVMLALCNAIGADPWFCIPHLAQPEFATHLATLARDGLVDGLRLYLEYSNEIWNFGFGQADWAESQATARWGAAGTGGNGWVQFAGMRAGLMMQAASTVFDGQMGRLVRVAGTATGWVSVMEGFLDAPLFDAEPAGFAPRDYFDCVAVTAYFHGGLVEEDHLGAIQALISNSEAAATSAAAALGLSGGAASAYVADHRYDDAFTAAARQVRGSAPLMWASESHLSSLPAIWAYARDVADARGLNMLMYEGGTHITPFSDAVRGNADVVAFMVAFNYSREMAQLYAEAIPLWEANGDGPFCQFVEVASPGEYGSWGARRWTGESNPRALLIDALKSGDTPPVAPTLTAIAFTGAPTVGVAVGVDLTGDVGHPAAVASYSWRVDGVQVSTAATYVPVAGDAGHGLTCLVRRANWFARAERLSASVAVAAAGSWSVTGGAAQLTVAATPAISVPAAPTIIGGSANSLTITA